MTDDSKGFVVATFAAFVVDVLLVDEVALVVPHCELVAVLGSDTVTAYAVDVLDSSVVIAVLSSLGEIKVYVDVVLLVLLVLQKMLTVLVDLMDQL